jgi:hypothetical protein
MSQQMKQRALEHEQEILGRVAKGGPPATFLEQQAINGLHNGAFASNIASSGTTAGSGALAGAAYAGGPLVRIPMGLYYSAKDLLTPRQPGETQADVVQRHLMALSLLPMIAGEIPGAGKQLEAVPNTVRGTTRRLVGASPGEVTEATGAAGEEAANIAERNKAATEKAQLANQTDISKAQGKYNQALAEHEGEGSEAQQEYQKARAQWEQENAEGPQKVAEQRAAEEAKQKQKQQLLDEANAHATELGRQLNEHQQKIEQQVKESYPEVGGEADAADIADRMKAAAESAMKEHGAVPGPIQRIISRYTPAESETGLEEGPGLHPGDFSAEALDQMMEQGIFLPDEAAALKGEGESAAKPNFANLHSQYSALGKLATRATDGYQRAAYLGAQDVLRKAMKELSDAEGPEVSKQFAESQGRFKQMARTFYNRTSPVAKAIAKYREVIGALQDDPNAAATAAPFLRQILSEPKAFQYAKQLLGQFEGSPVEALDAMKHSLDQAKTLPKQARVIPDYVPKPEPQPGEVGPPPVHEQPVPAHVADLTAPPEPFNKNEFIKGKMTDKARQLQHLSAFELGAPAFGTIGALEELASGRPGTALASFAGGMAVPGLRYGVGRLLEHPGFQEWVSREPGAGLKPGSATPFNAPAPRTTMPPGIKIGQPLSEGMSRELDSVWKEKGNLSRAETNSVQTVLNSLAKGTFTADEALARIRSALGLKGE